MEKTSMSPPSHIAIIMDGNGRWALARGLPRSAGHRAGATAVRRTIEAAPSLGITALTLYAFSADNWQRPRAEVQTLLRLLRTYLRNETARCVEQGVRLEVIGRRDRLPLALRAAIAATERATLGGRTLHVRIAIDYSARAAIARARRCRMWTCWCARAASSGSVISCCASARTPSCTSRRARGRISTVPRSQRLLQSSAPPARFGGLTAAAS
jgi:undecaprenyl pyrophosphate synthase